MGSLSLKAKRERAARVVAALKEIYPGAQCSLESQTPFQLLVAVRLSAQCTDARVNLVTPALFEAYPDAKAMSKASYEDIEKYIHSCGLYKTKAKDLVELSKVLVNEYKDSFPDTMEKLLKLPGVGRKTANLIMGDVFNAPAIVTDTHCIRITNRLGLSRGKEPYSVELQLLKVLDPIESNDFCHRLVLFGRDTCTARNPKCGSCPLRNDCDHGSKEEG